MTGSSSAPAAPWRSPGDLLTAVLRRSSEVLRPVSGVLVALALSGAVVLERLDGAIAQMHTPQTPAGGFNAVASPASLRDPQGAAEITRGWGLWVAPDAGVTAATAIRAYLVVDLAFAAVIAGLLVVTLGAVSRRSEQPLAPTGAAAQRVQAVQAMLAGGVAVVALYLVADWAETVALAGIWDWAVPGRRPVEPLGGLAVVGVASAVKLVALLLVMAALAIALVHRALAARPQGAIQVLPSAPGAPPGDDTSVVARSRPFFALRGQLVVLGVLLAVLVGLSGDAGRQVDDVVVRGFEGVASTIRSVAVAVGYALVLRLACRDTLRAYALAPTPASLARRAHLAVLVAGAAALGLGAWLLTGLQRPEGAPLVAVGGLLLLLFLLNLPEQVRQHRLRPQGPLGAMSWLVPYVVTTAPFALYLAVLRAAVRVWVDHGSEPWTESGLATLLLAAAVLVLAALALVLWLRHRPFPDLADEAPGRQREWARAITWLGAGLALLGVGAAWGPGVAERLGSVTIILAGLTVITAVVTGLVLVGDLWPARGSLTLLGLRRVPVLALVVVVGSAAGVIDTRAAYYDTRLLDGSGVTKVRLAGGPAGGDDLPASAFAQWTEAQVPGEGAAQPGPGAGPREVPLVLLSASGGGIRAAYWTSLAWECLYGGGVATTELSGHCPGGLPSGSVLLASSVSGSSVGLAMVRAHQVELDREREQQGDGRTPPRSEPGLQWLEATFDDDYLAPALAATLFRDLPNSILRSPAPGRDRSSTLERAWEDSDADLGGGFAASSYVDASALRFPVLLFNGTSVLDGCRVAVTVLDGIEAGDEPATDCLTSSQFTRDRTRDSSAAGAAPPRPANGVMAATKDAFRWTCDAGPSRDADRAPMDLRLSTAAMLSARFPYLSPSGRLNACDAEASTYVLDGGLVDNSGTDALVEAWQELEPEVRRHNVRHGQRVCVVPRLLMLDSGFQSFGTPGSESRPLQLLAPGAGLAGVFESRSSAAQQEAMIAVARSMATSAQCSSSTLPTVAHLFPLARPGGQAPLGWTLATGSRTAMQEEMAGTENCEQLAVVRGWYSAEAPDEARCG